MEVLQLRSSLRPPKPAITVVVKGSFALHENAPVTACEQMDSPTGDLPATPVTPTDPVDYPSDFAPFKPQADVVLLGCAYPPKPPADACEVVFRFGARGNQFERRLVVLGDRLWKPGIRKTMTARAPFSKMSLSWSNAFGGSDDERNPIGKGRQANADGVVMLPNLEDPRHLIAAPSDTPAPVGVGPIPQSWQQRWDKLGSYDRVWREA